jgi:hypothetical protein
LTDEEDLNNNNVNNQSLLSNYKSNENASTAHSNCVRDFFDCLRFRRNYKRNRKKCGKGQSLRQILSRIFRLSFGIFAKSQVTIAHATVVYRFSQKYFFP